MPLFRGRRGARQQLLLAEHFTPLEARELSKLPKASPALLQLRADRVARWERFQQIARWKLDRGRWRQQDLPTKWLKNLSRMYSKRGWRVKEGPTGAQQKMPKGSPNPWAAYRGYERETDTPKGEYPSVSRHPKGRKVDLGVVAAAKARKAASAGNRAQTEHWTRELDASIRSAKGSRREQLIAQRERLRRN